MDDLATPDAIRDLIGARLRAESRLFVSPDPIPSRQETKVRKVHRGWLPDDEPIIALYDDTLLGSGADGFALTTRRLLWRSFLGHPRQLLWTDLDPADISVEEGTLWIAGNQLPTLVLAQVEELAALLRELGKRHKSAELPRAPEAGISAAALLKRARVHLGERESVFYAPALPKRKLRTVRRVHAMPDEEDVLVLIDDSPLGSAADSVVLTDRRLCWRGRRTVLESRPWIELVRRKEPDFGLRLILHPQLCDPLIALIDEMVDELAARTTRLFCWSCQREVRIYDGCCSSCARVLVSQEEPRS